MLTENELNAIEARANIPTSGKWIFDPNNRGRLFNSAYGILGSDVYIAFDGDDSDGQSAKIAEFIAHFPADGQALIAEVRRLRKVERDAIEKLERIHLSFLTDYEVSVRTEKARQAALEEAAQIADDHLDPREYPYGTEIASSIRALKSGVGLHASQQPHATDAATAPRG